MKILITGATGFVGRYLIEKLLQEGHTILACSRNKASALTMLPKEVQVFEWSNVSEELPPKEAMENIEAVINLMGENLSEKRWSKSQKEKITDISLSAGNTGALLVISRLILNTIKGIDSFFILSIPDVFNLTIP